MRGRPRKPKHQNQADGNPGKRQPTTPPKPERGAIDCPAFLHQYAQEEWQAIIPELHRLGLLTRIDRGALAAYCQAWAEFHLATESLNRDGRTYIANGIIKSHPANMKQAIAWTAIQKFAALFGLDPLSRSRLDVEPPSDERDAMDDFLKGSP